MFLAGCGRLIIAEPLLQLRGYILRLSSHPLRPGYHGQHFLDHHAQSHLSYVFTSSSRDRRLRFRSGDICARQWLSTFLQQYWEHEGIAGLRRTTSSLHYIRICPMRWFPWHLLSKWGYVLQWWRRNKLSVASIQVPLHSVQVNWDWR